eukprot:CAMPEP_0113590310 /NCGR_PEP_ID=MMETSP0015_2-20120614/36600_1 /TAXON_ID=2838 /ORGANISM="Odontella" /LENGTH=547 /DNA_ID=CAMNT_0000496481 /DNA_START=110 /DNA_END=1750 /DNA_ORIENTATION=+ /assembly_acc=CAM_ASM_000160
MIPPPDATTNNSARNTAPSAGVSPERESNGDITRGGEIATPEQDHQREDDDVFHFGALLEAMREMIDAELDDGDELLIESTLVMESSKGNDVKSEKELLAEKSENEVLKRRISSLSDALAVAKGNLDNIGPAFATKTAHAKELEETIARMSKLKCKDDERFRTQAEEAEKLLIHWSKRSKLLASQKSRLEKDLADAKDEKEAEGSKYEAMLEELRTINAQISRQNEELESLVGRLKVELEQVSLDASRAQALAAEKTNVLEKDNKEMQVRNKMLEDQLAELQHTVSNLTSDKQKALDQIDAISEKYATAEEIISRDIQAKAELKGQVSTLSTGLQLSEERYAEIQSQLGNMTAERDTAIEQAQNNNHLLSAARSDLSNLMAERDHALCEREVSIERNKVLVGEKEFALLEMEGLRKEFDESQATAIDLRGAIADLEGNATLMKTEIDSLSGKSMGLGTMNEDLVKEKNKILEDLAAMTDKYNTSHDNVKDANESIDRLELQVHAIEMEREVSIERNQVLVGEKECALAEMEGLRKQLDESQATAIDL